jgi:uncharacterized protein YbbK (DUF523 family)
VPATDEIARRLADRRGRRVVFVSHCLLDENVRYLGGATRAGAVQEVLDRYVPAGVGLCQMPCPEQWAWGGTLKPRMTRLYGARALRWRYARRPFVAVARAWTAAVYRRLARRVAREIRDDLAAGCEVVEIVGVGASPSCGVTSTLDLDGAVSAMARCDVARLEARTVNRDVVAANVVAGRGLFVSALDRALARRGVRVRFVEHDLVAELRAAGAVAAPAPRLSGSRSCRPACPDPGPRAGSATRPAGCRRGR